MFRSYTSKRAAAWGLAAVKGFSAVLLSSEAANAAENISADIGYSYNTHFISYGVDVWGGGTGFYGSRSTNFFWGDFALKATDQLAFNLTVWMDVNNNTTSRIGGNIQEVDVNPGFSYTIGRFTGGITYNAWSYAGDVEESVDFSLAIDDKDWLIPGFAFAPKLVVHDRVSGNGAQQVGAAVVVSIGPQIPLGDFPVTLTIPAGIAFFTTDDFQGGTKGGYGYSYVGGSLGYPLSFIPESYGKWGVNFDLIGYFTDRGAIPGNPDQNFLYASMGVKVAY